MTVQDAQDQAAKEWNDAFDYRSIRNGVQVGNIKMHHIDVVNKRAMEIYATAQHTKAWNAAIEAAIQLYLSGDFTIESLESLKLDPNKA